MKTEPNSDVALAAQLTKASDTVEDRFPWWLRYQHYLNFFLLLFMIRSGLQILAEHPRLYVVLNCTPGREWFRFCGPVPPDRVWTAKDDCVALPRWLGLPAIRHAVGLARMWHFSVATLWLANGIIFYVLLFSTNQWHRLISHSWDVFPNALSPAYQKTPGYCSVAENRPRFQAPKQIQNASFKGVRRVRPFSFSAS